MTDPLEQLLIESESIYVVQSDPNEPTGRWLGTEKSARGEAEQRSLALGKPVYVFRAVARVKVVDRPVEWTEYP